MDKQITLSRKTPPHRPIHCTGNLSPIIFVTVCARERRKIFTRSEGLSLLVSAWDKYDAWLVGLFLLMPDHIHFFVSPRELEISLKRWMETWKSEVSRKWPWECEKPIWQRSFWDTQLRQGESYSEKWEYVLANPIRKNLAKTPEEWPYKGELHKFEWHDR